MQPLLDRFGFKVIGMFIAVVGLPLLLPSNLMAQTPTISVGTTSGAAGTAVDLPVSFTAGGTGVSTLQFDLTLPASLSYASVATGSAAISAGKSASGNAITGGVRVLIFGLNQNTVGSGSIAVVRLNIASGTAPATLPVGITGISASSPSGTAVSTNGAGGSVTVTAPALPTVTISATDPNASEAGPDTGIFAVTRSGSTSGALTVNYTVSGTAGAGSDYTALAGSVTLASGAASATITVTPIDDMAVEGNETVIVTLSNNAAYAIGGPNSATVTIADNDGSLPTVTVSATDPNASEAGPDAGIFTVTRSGSTSGALTVNYTVSGTASAGGDYTALAGSVNLASGAASATITVTPIDDATVEGNETVTVTLSSNAAYTVGSPGSATVTIADNDGSTPTVTISATDPTASEAGPDAGIFTVTRSGSTSGALTVNYTVSGTASAGSDYTALAGSVTLGSGAASATITVAPSDDTAEEGNETVAVTLSSNAAYSVGSPSSATITIADNDTNTSVPLPAPGTRATPSSEAIFIMSVIENANFRTNLGINNLSQSRANVGIILVDEDGIVLASKAVEVEADGLKQINGVARFLFDSDLTREIQGNLYLESHQLIKAWASQIENTTDDPSLLLSKRSGARKILIPSAANISTFKSSLVLMDVGSSTAEVSLKAYSTDGLLMGQTAGSLFISSNGVLSFENILQTLGVSNNYGPIEITSLNGVPLIASSRVSSANGTGGFFEGLDVADASLIQIIPHVIDTAELRTNIGINNVSDNPATVRVRIFDKNGVERGTISVAVAPKGLTQLNHAVRQLVNASDVSNLEGYLRLDSDQPIFGWASQIDNVTNDPGFAASKGQGSGRLVVQSTANVGNFRSSLVVVNTGSADALVDLVSRTVDGGIQGQLRGLLIRARGFFSSSNILASLGISSSFGPVEIVSINGQPLMATSRVYSFSGTSGFFQGQPTE